MTTAVAAIVVKFNRPLHTLPALEILSAESLTSLVHIIIVDNSPTKDNEAEQFKYTENLTYVWMGGNKGISRAFNRGVQVALNSSYAPGLLCFLDQDTPGVAQYLQQTLPRLSPNIDVHMPLVASGTYILSPCRRVGPWYCELKSPSLPKHFSCINSGLLVSARLASEVPFDQALFLDYVDHAFIRDALKARATFEALWDCSLKQEYSRSTDEEETALVRFGIFRSDTLSFYSSMRFGRVIAWITTAHRAISAALYYRSLSFLKEYANSMPGHNS